MKNLSLKSLSLKAMIYLLLTSILLFTVNLALAQPKVTESVVALETYVYLNKSTIDDLITLKGVGHKRAKAILSYRQKIGGFTSVSELINVKGIGEKVLLDNKSRLKI